MHNPFYTDRAAALVVTVRVEREADDFDMLATTSTMAVIAYFDAVCIALMRETGYTREQFAVIHPGGAVGERLARDATAGRAGDRRRHGRRSAARNRGKEA